MRSGCNRPGKARRRDGSRSADRHAIGVQQAGKGAPALGCDDHALLLVRWLRLGSVCGRRFAAGPRASSLPPRKGLEQISRRITFRSAGRSAHRSRPWRPLHRRPWSRSRPRATRGTPTALLRATRLRHGALTLASARAAQVAPDWLNGAHHRRAETGAKFLRHDIWRIQVSTHGRSNRSKRLEPGLAQPPRTAQPTFIPAATAMARNRTGPPLGRPWVDQMIPTRVSPMAAIDE